MDSTTRERYSWWDFIEVGYALRYLEDADSNSKVGQSGDDRGVIGHIEALIQSINELEMYETDRTAGRELNLILDDLKEIEEKGPNSQLGNELYEELHLAIRPMRFKLEEETQNRSLFPALPENHDSVEGWLNNPERHFGLSEEQSFEVPEYAYIDFVEAAKCFAIDLSAPAIVFAFRGTEALVRAFYYAVTQTTPSGRDTWNHLVKELEEYNVEEELLELLHEMRRYRNTVMHAGPRDPKKWNTTSAKKVFRDFERAVLRMINFLREQNLSFVAEDI